MKNSFEKYGRFSDDDLEFIIHRPDTPVPWINYISNGQYSGLVSNSGGGYSFFKNPKDNRITRWRYNSLPVDRPGRYLLLRDKKDGEFWSATWQPVPVRNDSYECRHGLYYTKITTAYKNIRTSVLFFVPEDDDLEIWHYTIKNESDKKIALDLFAYQELCLGHALVDLINQPNDQHFNEVTFHPEQQILTATKRYWVKYNQATVKQTNEDWDKLVYFASSLPVKSWDGSKNRFIGKWRSESNPIAVENGLCSNSTITSGDAIAALHSLIELEPGEQKEFSILMGIVTKEEGYDAIVPIVDKYSDSQHVKESFKRLKASWKNYLSAVQVRTPDPSMDRMLNVWNQYQTSVTFRFSRDASYHHGGLLFGRGYRDSCQDIMGPVIARPEWVKSRILEMCRYQFK
ncbi:MAG: glycosyl transferase family 36, partial [Candidatus Marinimicrobia bacterium]|nr:glycosyl transferase family 36 [Candidatus Neomarinimicrobiota bacterium]